MSKNVKAVVTVDKQRILDAMIDAEKKAWKSLAGYKFYMAGYWMANWVSFNKLLSKQRPNPSRALVKLAREMSDES